MSRRKTAHVARDEEWEKVIERAESELLQTDVRAETDAPRTSPVETNPTAKIMNAHEVANFVSVIASVQRCKEDDVSFRYEPLFDDAGNVLLTELTLIFSVRSLVDGVLNIRAVHSLRVLVPQEIQQFAKSMQSATLTKGN